DVMERDRSYFSNFREILMDEFQDTNELQDLLLQKVWREPEEQRLFLVGDIKQSIYRFRHAEPSLFLRYIRNSGARGGKYIPLDVSFRTRDALIREINSLFSSLWKEGIGRELSHPYEELRPPRELEWHERRQKTSIPSLGMFLENRKPEGEQVDDARIRLARRLGKGLLEMVDSGQMIWDKDLLEFRPVRWSDIAILVPTRTYYEPLEKIFLDELFIPCLFESSLGYYSRSEIQDLAALIKTLSDPEDEISLGHFLSSPFSGIPLNEGDMLLQKYSGKDLWEGLGSLYPEVRRKMEKWRKQAFLEGVSFILGDIIREPGIFLRFPPWKRKRAAANIRKAIDITREYETYMGHDLQGCAAYIEDAVGRGVRMEDALLPEEDDHIRILTVHASKGLEFPVVAIFGCEHTPRIRAAGTSLGASKKLGPVTSRFTPYGDRNEGDAPLSSRLHDILEKRDHQEEWERLFYVACTRARDSLILCGINGNEEGSISRGSWLSMALGDLPQDTEQSDLTPPDQRGHREKAEREKPSEEILLTPARPRALKKIGASAFALFRFCPHAYRMKYRQGRDLKWELPSEEERGGPQMGSLMHWILERWDFRADSVERSIPRDPAKASEKALSLPPALKPVWNDQEARSVLRSWLEGMSRNPFCQDLAKLCEKELLQREFPFCLSIEEDIHLVGVIDLLWKDGSGIHILDHKITPSEGSRPAQEKLYREQLSFYSLAMKKIHPLEEISGGIFYIRENQWHPLKDFPEWSVMEETVAHTARRAGGEEFSPKTENCQDCPFYRLCNHPEKGRS
ncbi:MAG: UvrD-helicase domain-containing protein, partial [Synergistales bacterium]|nr:UvrD-helicase domain-containing protein [Synergistales bacterium]